MQTIIEIKAGTGVVFSPLYVKTTAELIQDADVKELPEPVSLLLEPLIEAIIDETQVELRNFNYGHVVVAPAGSGYLHLQFEQEYPYSGTYLFPTVEAMAQFRSIVAELKLYLQQQTKHKKWEHVTLFRRVG